MRRATSTTLLMCVETTIIINYNIWLGRHIVLCKWCFSAACRHFSSRRWWWRWGHHQNIIVFGNKNVRFRPVIFDVTSQRTILNFDTFEYVGGIGRALFTIVSHQKIIRHPEYKNLNILLGTNLLKINEGAKINRPYTYIYSHWNDQHDSHQFKVLTDKRRKQRIFDIIPKVHLHY